MANQDRVTGPHQCGPNGKIGMSLKNILVGSAAGSAVSATFAGSTLGVDLGSTLGSALGEALGITLGFGFSIGSVALLAVGATSLAIGFTIVRRKQRR